MRFARSVLCLVAVGLLAQPEQESVAATSTATLSVTATINNNCTISTSPVGFPPYDPITAHASAPDDSTSGSVTITCTRGTTATVALGLGAHATGNRMRMASGSNFLEYALYQDAARTIVWRDSGSGLLSPGAAPSKAPRTYPVYGRIPGGQDLPAGTYTDTVTATVNF